MGTVLGVSESDVTEQTHTHVLEIIWAKPPAPCSRWDSGCCDQEPCLASLTAAAPLTLPLRRSWSFPETLALIALRPTSHSASTKTFDFAHTESCPGTKAHTPPTVEQNPLTQAPFSSPDSSKEVRGVCGDRSSETWLLNVY